jgi:uncharacterized protein YegP (UPF0339 family)
MGTFVIVKRLNGYYKYEFASRKGKPIFISKDFELRFECEEDIERLRKSVSAIFFMKFKTKNGKWYFKLILNQKEIAVSRKFTTQLLMEKGIDEIMRTIEKSEVLDFSIDQDVFPPAEDVFC